MPLFEKTPWKYDTSEETSYTGWVITGGEGKLYLKKQGASDVMKVQYNFAGAGVSRGAILNFSQSLTTDDSDGISHVYARSSTPFDKNMFPCQGWIVTGGATAGIFQPSFMSHSGLSLALMVFGFIPMGYVWYWGRFNSILPGAGPSVLLCSLRV